MSRFMNMALVKGITLAATVGAITGSADAQSNSSGIREGRRLAHAQCAQCHGVDRRAHSTNSAAPTFEDIANVPGMTATALTVALWTSHQSMPNLIIKGRDSQNIIAYILSLKQKE
ncbi:MAG: c-type cytochrome [Xanthobacteraceae bacterium]